MKNRIALATIVLFAAFAATGDEPQSNVRPPGGFDVELETAVVGTDLDVDSAKFNEYRDLGDQLYVPMLRINRAGDGPRFFTLRGSNVGRDDQNLGLDLGTWGSWSATVNWSGLPHRLTNKAASPYVDQGNGLFTVGSQAGILTRTADEKNYLSVDALNNDQRIASYLALTLQPLDQLGTQRNRGTVDVAFRPAANLEFALGYTDEAKEGSKILYGPIGDRPPRTLNVELPEPIDSTTRELRFRAAYSGSRYDLELELSAPRFENDIDTMVWESIFYGADSDGSDLYNNDVILAGNAIMKRAMSTFGQRPLSPDNEYQNATLTFGLDAPLDGRLTVSASGARMTQDERLLPYSYSSLTTNWSSLEKLPRSSADAEISTSVWNVDYAFNPMSRWNVRTFYRAYEMDNETPSSQWHYVTSDAASPTGGVSYKNKRINLAYEYDKANYGVASTFHLRKTTLGLEYQRESVDRAFRESNTDEDIVRATANLRPLKWLSVRARYLFGDRAGNGYDWGVNRQSYWYAATDANDADNPQFGFVTHPDLRRFDVSDRERNQYDLTASLSPFETLAFSVTYAYRKDDFDSDVQPVQPMAGTALAAANDVTPGVQLGLLANEATTLSGEVTWFPVERLTLTAFASVDQTELDQRGMGFNEAERTNLQSKLVGNPGQSWTDTANYWRGISNDDTDVFGVGASFDIVPGRLTLTTDYACSKSNLAIDYSGFGNDKPLTTTYYAYRSPEDTTYEQNSVNAILEWKTAAGWVVGFRYLYGDYAIDDWMASPEGGWVETVGSEYFVRDSTDDNRWGNRLVRLGSTLAPSYTAHVGFLTLGYRW